MSFSAHKNIEDIIEHQSTDTELESQAVQLAQWIRESRHFIAFTGAGISTSAGIPDFRGPNGVWTLRAQGKEAVAKTSTISAFPTPTHMALVALEKAGYLKFLISQNCDGLHRRSGFPPSRLAELHGNSNLEFCKKCKREFLRDFNVSRVGNHVHDHRTDRACLVCKDSPPIYDSIINFTESLPEKPLNDGMNNSNNSDLCLVLGSSLTVTPASDMPAMTVKQNGRLVIANLQRTNLDKKAKLRIFSTTDKLMTLVLKELDLELPVWKLERRLLFTLFENGSLHVNGISEDNLPASFIRQISLFVNGQHRKTLMQEPLEFPGGHVKINPDVATSNGNVDHFVVRLQFMGNYREPSLDIDLRQLIFCGLLNEPKSVKLYFDPMASEWTLQLL